MCTAICFTPGGSYFGRNFDLHLSYGEQVIITPRNYDFGKASKRHAMIGTGTLRDNYPLYYDAINEKGLGAAGLNFPCSAHYAPLSTSKENIAPYELIPYILSNCSSVSEAEELLRKINLADIPFSRQLPVAPMHWIFSDKNSSVVAEPTSEGLMIYQNPTGVLTNEPPFPIQLHNLSNYMKLSAYSPKNTLSEKLPLSVYSFGMGALGLPGDLSSASRFVKAVFTKENSVCDKSKASEIAQFFHILGAVCQQRGCVHIENGEYEFTRYSSCCNLNTGVYYYKTYESSGITAVDMLRENLDSSRLITYPLKDSAEIIFQN